MIRRLFKTGNSVVLSLPKEVLADLGIKDGHEPLPLPHAVNEAKAAWLVSTAKAALPLAA